jgi:FhuF 2Fe-2S C-terminal domain
VTGRPVTTPPADVDASAALAAAAEVGPYFVIGPSPAGPRWRPLTVLTADPAVLRERVGHARRVIAGQAGLDPQRVEERAAASIVFLGLASRLVSPALAAAVLGGVVPRLTAGALYWRPVDGGPWPLAAACPVTGYQAGDLTTDSDLSRTAALLGEHIIQGTVGPLAGTVAASFRLSRQVLWGNVASALAGAAGVLAGRYPERAGAAGRLTAAVLATGPLAGTGDLVQPDPRQSRRFLVRRNCCLFYRVPGGGLCGDCVLATEEARRRNWQAALRPAPDHSGGVI